MSNLRHTSLQSRAKTLQKKNPGRFKPGVKPHTNATTKGEVKALVKKV